MYSNISNEELLSIWKIKEDYAIVSDGKIVLKTDDFDEIESSDFNCQGNFIVYTSDFEQMFEIKDELIRRGVLVG